MTVEQFQGWLSRDPFVTISATVTALLLLFLIARNIIARGIIHISTRTQTKVDDILVNHLKPLRIAWLAPFLAVYLFSYLVPDYQEYIEKGALFIILWIAAVTVTSLFTAFNEIYESRSDFKGVSIQSYLDIAKILIMAIALILRIVCHSFCKFNHRSFQ